MLTSNLVRVRYARKHVVPCYLNVEDAEWQEMAERLIGLFRENVNRTRGELEEEIDEVFADSPTQQVHQGLAKLLENRCEFAVISDHPPEEIRATVFRIATGQRRGSDSDATSERAEQLPVLAKFNRAAVLEQAARELGIRAEIIERGLFADLRSEQQLISFKDISAERLLQRYNVALAQSVLLKAISIEVIIRNEPPQRYRQLLRLVKFYRLMCEIEAVSEKTYRLKLDGPLSLFLSTQKYGFQLAMFLPAILQCKDFELQADLRWGPKRAEQKFRLTSKDGLVSHYVDSGTYIPPELIMFVDLFRKRIEDWDISEETEVIPLGNTFWVPDFQLLHRASGQVVYLEVLGFWRRGSALQHLERLRQFAPAPFVLAVSDQLHVEETELEGLPAGLYRFRQMPLPDQVVKVASEVIG